jgi:hypothetical protein
MQRIFLPLQPQILTYVFYGMYYRYGLLKKCGCGIKRKAEFDAQQSRNAFNNKNCITVRGNNFFKTP